MQGLLADYLPDLLPDDPNKKEAMRNGLLNFGAALMGGRGNLGQILGSGLMAGSQGYAGSLAAQQAQALQDAQMQHYTAQNDQLKAATARQADVRSTLASLTQPPAVTRQPSAAAQLAGAAPDYLDPNQAAPLDAALDGAPTGLPPTPAGATLANLPKLGQATTLPPVAASGGNSDYADNLARARALLAKGYTTEAKPYLEAAKDMKTKYATEFHKAIGKDGKTHYYQAAEDGSDPRELALGVAPDIHVIDGGGSQYVVDYNAIQPGGRYEKTQSADSRASLGQSERHWQQEQKDANEPGKPNLTMAKQIAFYKAAPLGQFSLNKPWGQATMDEVVRLNPEYDAAQYAPRASALRSYAPGGKDSANIESINTGMNHIETLRQLALAQKSGDVRGFNLIANRWASATGQAAPTNLNMATQMIGPEVVKAVSGAAGTGEDRAHMAEALTGKGSYSPDQILGALGTTQELFAGRLREKKRSYERSTKLNNFEEEYLSPAARALLQDKAAPAAAPAAAPKSVKDLPQKAPVAALSFDDAAKERRYQEWKRSQAK